MSLPSPLGLPALFHFLISCLLSLLKLVISGFQYDLYLTIGKCSLLTNLISLTKLPTAVIVN